MRSLFYATLTVLSTALPLGFSAPPQKPSLEWETMTIEQRVSASSAAVDVAFKFKNNSTAPVRILSVVSSCGCTVGKMDKELYAAGESGDVQAHFQVAGKRGKQTSILTVKTDVDPVPIQLTLGVEVYEHMALGLRFLVWEKGASASKEVIIRFEDVGEVEKVEVTDNAPGFSAQATATSDPTVWKLVISRDTQNALRSTCIIRAKTEKRGMLESKVFMMGR